MATRQGEVCSGFNILTIVSQIYPHRLFSPRMFSRKSGADFYIKPHFFSRNGLKEIEKKSYESPVSYPVKGEIDLFILLTFDEKEIVEQKQELKEKNLEILVAIPHKPGDFYELLEKFYEIKDGGSDESPKEDLQNKLRRKLMDYVDEKNLSFYWKGSEIFSQGFKGRNLFYSDLLSRLFVKNYPFPLRLSHKKREEVVLESLSYLLELKKPLIFPLYGGSPAQLLLKSFLKTVSEKIINNGVFLEFILGEEVPQGSPLEEHWAILKKVLLNKENINMGQLFRTFQNPPFGLSFHNFLLITAAFWRVYCSCLKLYDTAGIEKIEMDVNAQTFYNVFREPAGKEIMFVHTSEAEKAYLTGIAKLIKSGQEAETVCDCFAVFKNWINSLSSLVRDIIWHSDEQLRELFAQFQDNGKDEICRDVMFNKLPKSLGMENFNFMNPAQVRELHMKLKEVLVRVDQSVKSRRENILYDLGKIFGVETSTQELVHRAMKNWLGSIEKEIHKGEYSHDARSLIEVLSGSKESDDIVFTEVPRQWNMDESTKWQTDKFSELLYRIWAAKLELDNRKFMDYTMPSQDMGLKDRAKNLVITYLDKLEEDGKEKIFHLLDLSEKYYIGL